MSSSSQRQQRLAAAGGGGSYLAAADIAAAAADALQPSRCLGGQPCFLHGCRERGGLLHRRLLASCAQLDAMP